MTGRCVATAVSIVQGPQATGVPKRTKKICKMLRDFGFGPYLGLATPVMTAFRSKEKFKSQLFQPLLCRLRHSVFQKSDMLISLDFGGVAAPTNSMERFRREINCRVNPTPLVLGDNRPARLIPTSTPYLAHPLEGYKSPCHIETENMSLSRQADIPVHSSRSRSTCVRGTQHNGDCLPKSSFYRSLKLKSAGCRRKKR
ncbi:hypothetical protein TNCV_1263411 [Trichonephila clavipes]|nr:hypothetical protein TNCV_1263411 [Trichonephila clavipes]